MSFTSIHFFMIVIVTILLYFVTPSKYKWYVLLASSCYFYVVAAGLQALLVALFSVVVCFFAAIYIEKSNDDRKRKKLFLAIGVVIVLAILAIVKLKKFEEDSLSWVIVPLGVSYYSFSLIGYLVDVYSKKQSTERNFLKMVLYTLYFPKIMQGPISKFRDLEARLIKGHSINYQNICYGFQRILWGYFKKLVIVERAALLTSTIFDGNLSDYTGGGCVLILATFVATIKHYCDFSGYMDIVVGVSQIMGIELDENFKQPFFSKTAAEFWRRWHITLGVWFKDYVYMFLVANPVVIRIGKWVREHIGKRAGKNVVTIIPLAVVWFLTGVWHGTGIDYIVWGCYWGTIIIISNIFSSEINSLSKRLHINTKSSGWAVVQTVRTFMIFVGGLLISTFVGLSQLKSYIWYLFRDFGVDRLNFGTLNALGIHKANAIVLFVSIASLWIVEAIQYKGAKIKSISELRWFIRLPIYALLILAILMCGVYGPGYSTSGFAYTHF